MVVAISVKECAAPGCSTLVEETDARCTDCRAEQRRDSDARRVRPFKHLYNTRRWRGLSATFRKANPLCKLCSERGLTVASEEVDHIVTPQTNPGLFWSWSNLQALCGACHSAKTATEDGGFGRRPGAVKSLGSPD